MWQPKCTIGTLNANITINLILTPKYKDHLYLFKLYQHYENFLTEKPWKLNTQHHPKAVVKKKMSYTVVLRNLK